MLLLTFYNLIIVLASFHLLITASLVTDNRLNDGHARWRSRATVPGLAGSRR